jgi:ribonuclease HI
VTVQLHTSASARGGRVAAGVVIRNAEGRTLRVIAKSLDAASREEATYRGLLHGLWRARTMGARRIQVYCDDANVIAQLDAGGEVPEELVGLYLQTRAMLNAYRSSTVELVERDRNAEAALAALDALEQEPDPQGLAIEEIESMPLWEHAKSERVGTRN